MSVLLVARTDDGLESYFQVSFTCKYGPSPEPAEAVEPAGETANVERETTSEETEGQRAEQKDKEKATETEREQLGEKEAYKTLATSSGQTEGEVTKNKEKERDEETEGEATLGDTTGKK